MASIVCFRCSGWIMTYMSSMYARTLDVCDRLTVQFVVQRSPLRGACNARCKTVSRLRGTEPALTEVRRLKAVQACPVKKSEAKREGAAVACSLSLSQRAEGNALPCARPVRMPRRACQCCETKLYGCEDGACSDHGMKRNAWPQKANRQDMWLPMLHASHTPRGAVGLAPHGLGERKSSRVA